MGEEGNLAVLWRVPIGHQNQELILNHVPPWDLIVKCDTIFHESVGESEHPLQRVAEARLGVGHPLHHIDKAVFQSHSRVKRKSINRMVLQRGTQRSSENERKVAMSELLRNVN